MIDLDRVNGLFAVLRSDHVTFVLPVVPSTDPPSPEYWEGVPDDIREYASIVADTEGGSGLEVSVHLHVGPELFGKVHREFDREERGAKEIAREIESDGRFRREDGSTFLAKVRRKNDPMR
jgi:hypothetical protein